MRVRVSIAAALVALLVGCPAAAFGAATSTHVAAPDSVRAPDLDSASPAITFDEVALGTSVTTEYAGQGVVFDSDVFTTSDGSNPTSPVLSGTPKFQGDITAHFVVPGTTTPTTVNGFSLDVGYIDSRNSVVVDYLDINGTVVGSQYAQSYGINHLTITYRGVAGFTVYTVSDEPAGFAIDNLAINPTVSQSVTSIASMGDSYSSGEGRTDGKYDCGTDLDAGTYYQDTTVPYWDPLLWLDGYDCDTRTLSGQRPDLLARAPAFQENKCHRHGDAYPNGIARILGAQQSIFVACSGARTFNVGATAGLNTPKAQYAHSPVNVAGGETQLKNVLDFRHVRLGDRDPDVITIGIGGNDAGFVDLVTHCVLPWTGDCEDGTAWADEVLSKINGEVFDKLVDTFTTLRDDFPNSTLLVFGYPTVVDPGEHCQLATGGMDANETRFLGGTVLDTLNSAVSDAAAEAGAFYIDISRVTAGHGVCAPDPWVNGIMLSGIGVRKESLHPNVTAHQQIAQYFKDHYTDGQGHLLVANPTPSGTIRPAVGHSMHLATINGQVDQSCGANCLQPSVCVQACQIHLQGDGYSPNAQLHLVLHSDPVDLGDVTADSDGHLDTTVSIPPGTPPGLHWITADGTAPDGDDQFGAFAVTVYETAPPPTRVHPTPTPPAPPAPAPTTPAQKVLFASFGKSPKTVRVGKTGRFSYTFAATARSRGRIQLASVKSLKIGHRKMKLKVGAKAFSVPALGKVKVAFKLSRANLKALKRAKKVPFTVTVTLGGRSFKGKVTLQAARR